MSATKLAVSLQFCSHAFSSFFLLHLQIETAAASSAPSPLQAEATHRDKEDSVLNEMYYSRGMKTRYQAVSQESREEKHIH